MELQFITEHYLPIVLAACLVLGYILKTSLDCIPNKYIPLILALTGAVLSCAARGAVGLEAVVYGACTGLASTGMHQAFKGIIEGRS